MNASQNSSVDSQVNVSGIDVDVPLINSVDGYEHDLNNGLNNSLNNAESLHSEALSSEPASDRYILTHVGTQQLAFPAQWVAEILLVERSQILNLPFYDPMLLGVIHHHGKIVPLVSIWQALAGATAPNRETLCVVQLSQQAGRLSGIGIVVDRASDTRMGDALFPPASLQQDSLPIVPIQFFQPQLLNDSLWKPQRWQPLF